MKKQIDYASVTFGTLFIVAVVASAINALGLIMDTLGIQLSGMWTALIGGLIWCVIIGFIMWYGMRKEKMKNGN